MNLKSSKKGSIADGIVWIAFLLVGAVFMLVGYMVLSGVNTGIQNLDDTSGANMTQAKNIMGDFTSKYPSTFDGAFLMLMVGLLITSIIFALLIDSNPAFFMTGIIVIIILLIIAGIFGNFYIQISETTGLSSFAQSFPIMNFFFNHIVLVVITFIGILAIVIWAKPR